MKTIYKLDFHLLTDNAIDPGDPDCPYIVTDSGVKAKPVTDDEMHLLSKAERREIQKFEREADLYFPCTIEEVKAWADRQAEGFSVDEKRLGDDEITIERFFPVLRGSLSSGEDPFRKLDELRDQGVKFRSAQRGLLGEDLPVEDIGIAIVKARKAGTITAELATVQVKFSPIKTDYEKVRLCNLYVRREEVETAYLEQGIKKYPWPGFDPHDEKAERKREIALLLGMKAETPLERESQNRQIAECENKLSVLIRRDKLRHIELRWFFRVLALWHHNTTEDPFELLDYLRKNGLKVFTEKGSADSDSSNFYREVTLAIASVKEMYKRSEEQDDINEESIWKNIGVHVAEGHSKPIGEFWVDEHNLREVCAKIQMDHYYWPLAHWPYRSVDLERRDVSNDLLVQYSSVGTKNHEHGIGQNSDRLINTSPIPSLSVQVSSEENMITRKTSSRTAKKRRRRITLAVERARESLIKKYQREPSADEVINHLEDNDETGCIVDYKDNCLIWVDTNNKDQKSSHKSIANLLSKIKNPH